MRLINHLYSRYMSKLKKVIKTGKQAQKDILNGIDSVADIVTKTLGPSGRNVLIEQTFYNAMITNDGIRVARNARNNAELNETESLGAQLLVDIADAADKEGGDGTTTTIALSQALAHKGFKLIGGDTDEFVIGKDSYNPMQLKRKIDEELEYIVEKIKDSAVMPKTVEELIDVASVSMESKKDGEIIGKLLHEIGTSSEIKIKFNTESDKTEVERHKGFAFIAGYASPYFAKNTTRLESVVKNGKILLVNGELNDPVKLFEVIKETASQDVPLVVIADEFSQQVVQVGLKNFLEGGVDVQLVKRAAFKAAEIMEDIAVFTGSKPCYESEVSMDKLGRTIPEINIIRNKVTLVDDDVDLSEHIEKISKEKDSKDRVNRLTGGVAIIKIGGKSYSDRNYIRHKYEDSVNATRGAIDEGYVKGRGYFLKELDDSLPEDFILKGILSVPHNIIMDNAGENLPEDDKIIDSARVIRSCVENACSVVSILITTAGAISTQKGQEESLDSSAKDDTELGL